MELMKTASDIQSFLFKSKKKLNNKKNNDGYWIIAG